MTYYLSPHTIQMNAWIGLCQLDDRFPDTLAKLGYTVEVIEPGFSIKGDYIEPDLILTAHRRKHSLLLDFKSYQLKDHQNERYETAVQNPDKLVLRGAVQGISPDELEADFSYSSFGDLTELYDLTEFDFTTVQFEAHVEDANLRIEIVGSEGFGEPDLDDAFPIEVPHGKDIPTDYYPFDAEEEDHTQFCIYMLNAAIQLAGEYDSDPFNVDELLAESHKLWSSMSEEKKKELRSLGEDFLDKYNQEGLDKHLRKVQKDDKAAWFHKSSSFQALRNKADEFITELEDELAQRKLSEF